jgi:hypothetical protein
MLLVLDMQMWSERVLARYAIADVVLDAGAEVDKQDNRQWSALMWATSNSHPLIVRLLLDHGASLTVKTGAGRTVLDFVGNDGPNREIEGYLRQSNGNEIGSVGVGEDWYDRGFGGDVEEQFAESERKRRMMMDSAFNLEVDLSSLGLDEPAEVGHSKLKPTNHRNLCRTKTYPHLYGRNVFLTKCLYFPRPICLRCSISL